MVDPPLARSPPIDQSAVRDDVAKKNDGACGGAGALTREQLATLAWESE